MVSFTPGISGIRITIRRPSWARRTAFSRISSLLRPVSSRCSSGFMCLRSVQEQVHFAGQLLEVVPGRLAAGLHRRVPALLLVLVAPEQLGREVRLGQRLAARKGEPATGGLERDGVLHDLGQHVGHGQPAPHQVQGLAGALVRARPAEVALRRVHPPAAFGVGAQGPRGAGRQAQVAAKAALLQPDQVGARGMGLGIAAPQAMQGTALEEHRGAQARPVMEGVGADVEDEAFGRFWHLRPRARRERGSPAGFPGSAARSSRSSPPPGSAGCGAPRGGPPRPAGSSGR